MGPAAGTVNHVKTIVWRIGGWGRECASFPPNWEIVSFRSRVRARGVSYRVYVSSDEKSYGAARYLLSFATCLGIFYLR